MIPHSKISSDGDCGGHGGCGSSSFKIKRPTLTEKMHSATIIIMVDHKEGVRIEKNRYGTTGKPSTKELVDVLCTILADYAFDGRMKIFQAGMKKFLKRAVHKTLKKGMI